MMEGMGLLMTGGIFSFLIGLLLIFLFIVVVVAAVKWLWGEKTLFIRWIGESAFDVLKKRYPSGEIGREEFERVREDIE
ncbi:MAG: SHOCT domain-containing protein [Thermodesulfobacteriota bacterium]